MPFRWDIIPKMAEEKIKFEKALERLEEIVGTLEGGDMELEKSLKMFEEGIKMARICQTHLSQAEKKIEKLVKDNKGELTTEPMEEAPSSGEGESDDGVPF
jgi:exodeoxyribonuclease VII small subunit